MALYADDEPFGECGLQDCGSCGALPLCPTAKKKRKKKAGGYKKIKTYRIVKLKGGRVAIIPAGKIKCRSRKVVKKMKPKVPVSW